MRSFCVRGARRHLPIALLSVGLALLLATPLAGVLGAGTAPASGAGAPSSLASAIASLAHGAGPAAGTSLTCNPLSSTQASCGTPATPAGGIGSPGTGNGSWIPIAHTLCCAGMAYDPYVGRVVLYGGMNQSGAPLGATWTYRAGNWSQVLTSPLPPARFDPALVFDAKDNYVLLFGGVNRTTYLNDTWTYQSGAWQQITTSIAPPPLAGASITYDAHDGYVVLFGGHNATTFFNSTWTYAGGTWTNRSSTSGAIGPRASAAMTFDPVDHYVVLFGGYNGVTYLGGTWSYASGAWTRLTVTSAPSARDNASMAWDPALDVAVLFGGQNGSPLGDTWTFVHGNWSRAATTGPSARSGAMMAFDGANADNYLLLFAGVGSSYQHDTWNYTASGWNEVSNGDWPPTREGASVVWDPLAGYALLFGGTNGATYFNDTWKYYGGTWTELFPALSPSPRADASMAFLGANASAVNGYVVLFGGVSATGYLNDSWEFSNGTWTPLSPTHSPSPRAGASLVFNNYYGTAVLFGGKTATGYVNDTWWFNSTAPSWVNVSASAGAPSPRAFAATTFDPRNDTILLFGGQGPTGYLNGTWELRGGNQTAPAKWSPDLRTVHPSARSGATLVWDTVSGYAVLFGGSNATSATLADMWIFASANWSQVSASPGPSARSGAAAFFDPAEYTLVLFGGAGASGPLNDTWEWGVFIIRAFVAPYTPVDVGVAESFYPTVFGGLPPYTYLWSFGDGNSSTQRAPTYAYSLPSSSVPYHVALSVNDSSTNRSSTWFNLTVNPKLATTASATPTAVDVGATVQFSGSYSGGTAPYRHVWLFGDGSRSSSLTPTHTYSAAGTYTATLWVNDSGGMSVPHNLTITVSASPVATIVATPGTTDVGSPVHFSAQVSGGVSPYTYSWRLSDGSVSAAAAFNHTFASAGNFLVQVWVNDSFESAHATMTEVVNPALNATIASSVSTVETGGTVEFWGNASGGTPPYQLSWHFGDGTNGTGANPSHVYSAIGTYEVMLWANDSAGQSVFRTLNISVVGGPSVVASATPSATDVGLDVSFSASVSGGVAPYTVTWEFGDGTTGTGTSVRHAYSAAGTKTVTVVVNDSRGGSAQQPLSVLVNPSLAATANASSTETDPGLAVQFSGSGTGGTAPITFAWRFGDGTGSTSATSSHAYAASGTYAVTLWVNDSVGMSVVKTLSVTVHPAPAITSYTVWPANVTVGSRVQFNVTDTGGTGGLSLSYSGLPSGCASANTTTLGCLPNATGTFTVQVTATDLLHVTATANVTLTVTSAPTRTSGFLGLSGDTGYLVIAAVVVALGAVGGAVWYWRRRAPPVPPTSGSP